MTEQTVETAKEAPAAAAVNEYNLEAFNPEQLKYTPEQNQKTYFVDPLKPKFNVQETAKRYKYLLGLTSLFSHFINSKAEKDAKFRQVLDILNNEAKSRRRKTEKEEDAELLKDEQNDGGSNITEFTESPAYINGKLRPYQIDGLNWLVSLHENNISGILADEMGLGKTLQTISFLGYLRYIKRITGPHLVIVPKSTLDNWSREFAKWTPEVNVFILQGDKESRDELIKKRLLACDFDVCISSYEIVIKEKAQFRKFDWQYIIIDEAHRIKNEESMLSQIIRMFHSKNRLLITGTPLQNNLHELWALLNFILPDVFADSDSFDQWFVSADKEGETAAEQEKEDQVIKQLHKVLKPFLLRRIKNDVEKSLLPKKELDLYLGMSEMQRTWYQKILEKDIDAVNGQNKRESKTRLLNIVMQLRKCCNHPYLFDGAEPGPPYTTDEHLVYNSQKLKVLDKLLKKYKEEGSRVLIFSQMSRMLDILEDYCVFRQFQYCRIDGQTDHSDRVQAIDEYNAPDSEKFIFLLTTRAGGLGINLTTADVVVLYDSDWNPQADLQAMDRAHRIGQTKQVKVFRLVTENAIEEKVLERATQKLRLDQLVIQQGRTSGESKAPNQGDLLNMIQFGAQDVFSKTETNNDKDDFDLEALLQKSEEKTSKLSERYSKLGLDDLQKFASDSAYEWNGEDFKKKQTTPIYIPLQERESKRERVAVENYSIDTYYKDVLNTGRANPLNKNLPPRPKQPTVYDHQFLPTKLLEIFDKENNYYKKITGYVVPLPDGSKEDLAQREADQKLLQLEIKNSSPLTPEEEEEKAKLLKQGFPNWNKKDFYAFIAACTKYGRNSVNLIAREFPEKTIDDVRSYCEAFWRNYKQVDGYERYITQIHAGEEKIRRIRLQKECLRVKLADYDNPLRDLVLKYPPATTNRRVFSDEEDRYLLVQIFRFGIDRPDLFERIRDSIRSSPLFRFDFFFQSRLPSELSRRAQTLLACVTKEKKDVVQGLKRKAESEEEEEEEDDEDEEEDEEDDDNEEDEIVDDDEDTEMKEASKTSRGGRRTKRSRN